MFAKYQKKKKKKERKKETFTQSTKSTVDLCLGSFEIQKTNKTKSKS